MSTVDNTDFRLTPKISAAVPKRINLSVVNVTSSLPSTEEICSRADVVITNEGKVGKQIKAALRGRIF